MIIYHCYYLWFNLLILSKQAILIPYVKQSHHAVKYYKSILVLCDSYFIQIKLNTSKNEDFIITISFIFLLSPLKQVLILETTKKSNLFQEYISNHHLQSTVLFLSHQSLSHLIAYFKYFLKFLKSILVFHQYLILISTLLYTIASTK